MKSKRAKHKESNRVRTEAVQELRRSSASGTHGDRRTKRLKTREAQKSNSMREFD